MYCSDDYYAVMSILFIEFSQLLAGLYYYKIGA